MKTWKNLTILALIAIIGLISFIACEDKDDGGGDPDPLEGTWIGILYPEETTLTFVAKNGSFTVLDGTPTWGLKGIYTVSGSTVNIERTHSKSEGNWIENLHSSTGTVSGNTFIWLEVTFTKQ